jgi:flavin-dependent dehydrogenase
MQGTLVFSKIKGSHTAMKSGMLAAEAIFKNIDNEDDLNFNELIQSSWIQPSCTNLETLDQCFINLEL